MTLPLRKYRVKDVREGLRQIKRELGEDAVIVSTSRLPHAEDGRNLEIAVAPSDSSSEFAHPPMPHAQTQAQAPVTQAPIEEDPSKAALVALVEDLAKQIRSLSSEVRHLRIREEMRAEQPAPAQAPAPAPRPEKPELPYHALESIRLGIKRIYQPQHTDNFGQTIAAIYEALSYRGVLEGHIEELIAWAFNADVEWELSPGVLHDVIEQQMIDRLETTPPLWETKSDKPEVAVFVGPTGVGKTTTIAKVAAHAKLVGNKRVGIICADTFRIGGLYQLETYADLVGVPIFAVSAPAELRLALSRLSDFDLILVDTMGRSPWAPAPSQGLAYEDFARACRDDFALRFEICMSATRTTADMVETVRSYARLQPASLVFTKLDESRRLGSILSTSFATELPVSHVCYGPRVPEDIASPDSQELVDWIMLGERPGSESAGEKLEVQGR
jgi:flagellar biosynthesis protein FlhF